MNRKKIIFIITSLYGHGGTTRVATLLANSLSSYHDITILSRHSKKNTYPLDNKIKDIKFTGNTWSFLRQCKMHINDKKPDIVIAHTMSKLTPALLFLGVKANAIWSFEHTAYDFHNWKYNILRKLLYSKLSKVLTLTNNDKNYYESIVKSVSKVSNPSPLTLKGCVYDKSSKNIISVGRLAPEKGYDLLIKAWLIIEERYPDWSLDIYGEGEEHHKLEQFITENNIRNIALRGLIDNVQNVYDNAAFYVMSSRFEGFGMVLIEAQSRGLPIVSFDCPSGPAEIVHHNIDGLLVENGNVLTLAKSMIKLIKDESLRESMSKHALDAAKAYQIDTVIEKWLYLLESS